MTCFNPKYAKWEYGETKKHRYGMKLKIISKKEYELYEKLRKHMSEEGKNNTGLMCLPCQKCLGCKLDYSKMWGLRGLLESQQWKYNCFITLTYNNAHLPKDKNLHKEDVQDFLKRLRKNYTGKQSRIWNNKDGSQIVEYPIRTFYSGEYGDLFYRSHFHVGIFNWAPNDLKFLKYNKYGDPLYTSKQVERLWSIKGTDGKYHQIGFVTVEEMNFNTAQYIARYTVKKCFNDHDQTIKNKGLKPEFIETSRKGGLGYQVYENKELWEKMKRNYGFFVKTRKGLKLYKIPQFYKNKWKDKDEYTEYFAESEKHRKQTEETFKELLEKTGYTKDEQLAIQKRTIIQKLKAKKSLKRNRIENDNDMPLRPEQVPETTTAQISEP